MNTIMFNQKKCLIMNLSNNLNQNVKNQLLSYITFELLKLKFYFVNMSNSLITASASQKIVKYLSCYQTYCKLCFGALATWKPPSAYYLQLKHSVEILKAKFIQMTLVRIVIHCLQLGVFISIDTIPGVFISIDTIPIKRNALSITCAKSVWPLKSTVFL